MTYNYLEIVTEDKINLIAAGETFLAYPMRATISYSCLAFSSSSCASGYSDTYESTIYYI